MNDHNVRPAWDFDYAPIATRYEYSQTPEQDFVLATTDDVDPASIAELLCGIPGLTVTPLFSSHPVFWTRIESSQPLHAKELAHCLQKGRVRVRYVASARRGSMCLPPPLDLDEARPRRASDWSPRTATQADEPETPWRWFLRDLGVDVLRSCCGTGAGTRLALIDNDGRDLSHIQLDAQVLVGADRVPTAQSHAALLLAWAVGATRPDGTQFRGVAPDASPRLYCIPKDGENVWSLPLAILRAAEDGADVVVCATYAGGITSPLLDDALEFAARLGRGGRGTAVLMPTSREMSSPPGSMHSSLSLGMSEPASDPRVFCIAPSARDGGWFLWRDKKGKLRPFANRGPAVRWLAPGDDLAYPFSSEERPWHAESSGASSLAAGVVLLVLGCNPELSLKEVDMLLTCTASGVDPNQKLTDPELADQRDLEPAGVDADRHNAKHGYGRLSAAGACIAASDPFAWALWKVGDPWAAQAFVERRQGETASKVYSDALARWAVRTVLKDAELAHSFCVLVRAARLACRHPERAQEQSPGQLLRLAALLVRLLGRHAPPPELTHELGALDEQLRALLGSEDIAATIETACITVLGSVCGWERPLRSGPTHASVSFLRVRDSSGERSPASGPSRERPLSGSR